MLKKKFYSEEGSSTSSSDSDNYSDSEQVFFMAFENEMSLRMKKIWKEKLIRKTN